MAKYCSGWFTATAAVAAYNGLYGTAVLAALVAAFLALKPTKEATA